MGKLIKLSIFALIVSLAFVSCEERSYPYEADDTAIHTHSYAETITKEATCTEEGEKQLTCSCGASYTESIAIDPDNHVGSDGNTGLTITGADYVASDCEKTGKLTLSCTLCNATVENTIKSDHNNLTVVESNLKLATTTATGEITDASCSDCNEGGLTFTIEKLPEELIGSWSYVDSSLPVTVTYTFNRDGSAKISNDDTDYVWFVKDSKIFMGKLNDSSYTINDIDYVLSGKKLIVAGYINVFGVELEEILALDKQQ